MGKQHLGVVRVKEKVDGAQGKVLGDGLVVGANVTSSVSAYAVDRI